MYHSESITPQSWVTFHGNVKLGPPPGKIRVNPLHEMSQEWMALTSATRDPRPPAFREKEDRLEVNPVKVTKSFIIIKSKSQSYKIL